MDIQLVIFDFDGTLADTRSNIVRLMQRTMRECGLPVASEDACASTIGLLLDRCFLHLYPGMSEAESREYAGVYRRIFEAEKKNFVPAPFPHVRETLDWLIANNYAAAIASSRTSVSLREFADAMGFSRYFDCIVGGEEVSCPKPDPEAVLKITDSLGVPPSRAMVVGDMPVDVMMGIRAGVHTCAVTYGNASRPDLEKAGAEILISDMAELPGVLAGGQ